jgi:hypothetical protein
MRLASKSDVLVTLDEINSSTWTCVETGNFDALAVMHACIHDTQEQTSWKDVYRMYNYTQATNRRLHTTRPPQKRCQEDQNITTK